MRKYLILLLIPFLFAFTWNGKTISTWNGKTLSNWNGVSLGSCVVTFPSFTAQTGIATSTLVYSNTITPTYSAQCAVLLPMAVTISGGGSPQFSINGGAFGTTGNITTGLETLQLDLTSSGSNYTTLTGTPSIDSQTANWTAQTILAAPTVTPTAGNTQVSLASTTPSGTSTYNGYWGTSSVACGSKTKVTGVANPWVKTGLTNGTPYYFNMTAVDANSNESACSTEVTATPTAPSDTFQFGISNNTDYTSDTSSAYVNCQEFTGTTATIDGIKIYTKVAGHFKVAIYDSNGSHKPINLLGSNNTSTSASANAWHYLAFTSSVSTTSGTKYNLCTIFDTDGTLEYQYFGSGQIYNYWTATYSGYSFPSSAPTSTQSIGIGLAIGAWGY